MSEEIAAPEGWTFAAGPNAVEVDDDQPARELIGAHLRMLVVHPGASWSTADVYNGLRFGLSWHGVQTYAYNVDVRIARSAHWLRWNWKKSGKPGDPPTPRDAQYHAASGVLERAFRVAPDWILIVSGMYFDLEIVQFLKRAGFKLALLLTESPYDDDAQAEYIKAFDLVWTNERTSVDRLRQSNPNVWYLPHAWHPLVHRPSSVPRSIPRHDVLFIGTGFKERIALLREADIDRHLALYGFWPQIGSRSPLRKCVRGQVVENEGAALLYQRAKINLSMHRTSKGISSDGTAHVLTAESLGPRVWELAATGSFFISDRRAELERVFGDIVPTFGSAEELRQQVKRWLRAPARERKRVADACMEAVADDHWNQRAEQVLADIRQTDERRAATSTRA